VIEVGDLSQGIRELALSSMPDTLPSQARGAAAAGTHSVSDAPSAYGTAPRLESGEVSLENYERMCLVHALEETGGDKVKAATLLGLGKSTFYRKLKTYGIT
jgi:DNA-binding NtrC family response regulator